MPSFMPGSYVRFRVDKELTSKGFTIYVNLYKYMSVCGFKFV